MAGSVGTAESAAGGGIGTGSGTGTGAGAEYGPQGCGSPQGRGGHPSRGSVVKDILFFILRNTAVMLAHILYRLEILGRENIPKQGPVMFVCNHTFYKDLALAHLAVRRRIHWSAKVELFNKRWKRWLLDICGAVLVNRDGNDREAVKRIMEYVQEREFVGMFPEGARVKRLGICQPVTRAFVSIAQHAGVPIVPVAICYGPGPCGPGSFFSKIRVRYGAPVSLDAARKYAREELQDAADAIMGGIYEEVTGFMAANGIAVGQARRR